LSEATRSVDRALDILLCFSTNNPELSMTQIAEKTVMNKSTVHRLLATLEAKRFVERDPASGLYHPGNRLLQLSFLTLERNDLRSVAAPFIKSLNELYKETITLSILDDTDVVYIDVLESPQSVKMSARPGKRMPAYCTASGKAIMAYASEQMLEKIYAQGFVKYSEFTVIDPKIMQHVLELVRERGFGYSEEEYEDGINAVASPILDSKMKPLAAIAVAGPAYRLPVKRLLEIGPSVAEAARKITAEYKITSLYR
jgi:IclR family transcriptional regulator, KDG regulon repressor